MKIITKYLAREVYGSMLAAIVILLLIFLSNQFIRFMHYAAVGQFSSHMVSMLLLLQLPLLAAQLLPVSLFIAILLAYGRLNADSEMTVLMACGVSPISLLKTTISFSAVVMLVVAALSLWINPKVYKYNDQIFSGATSSAIELLSANRFTPVVKDKWIFYVDQVLSDRKHFAHVFAAQQPDLLANNAQSNLDVVVSQGAYEKIDDQTGNLYLVLTDGYRYSGTPGTKNYEMVQFSEYGIRLQQELNVWQPDASSVPTLDLWRDRQNNFYAAELQWRFSLPLSALILTLLGTPLSKIRPRRSRYVQLAPAFLFYIIYANLLFLAKAWVKKGSILPGLGMWWVHGLMLIIAIGLIGLQMKWRRKSLKL